MAKKTKIFDTIEDYNFWIECNCKRCNIPSCYTYRCFKASKNKLETTKSRIKFIGMGKGKLRLQCQNFTKVFEKSKNQRILIDNFIMNIF